MELFLPALGILLAGALIMAILAMWDAVTPPGKLLHKLVNWLGAGIAALACAIGFCAAVAGPWNFASPADTLTLPWGLPFGQFNLAVDPLARIFLLPVFGLGFTCSICGGLTLQHDRPYAHNLASHWFFYILLLLGMTLVLLARDAVLFILSWEIMSLAPFFLIDYNDEDSKVRDAAWIYLTAAHLGAVLLIAFFALLWQTTGQTALDPISTTQALQNASPVLRAALFLLALFGFGAKAGLAPLHVWLPEAHPAAPSHVSALLSGAMINVGIYGIIRAINLIVEPISATTGILGSFPAWWAWLIIVLGLATALIGILKALGQRNLKRLLAYSSVENIGLMLTALGIGLVGIKYGEAWIAVAGLAGCLLHMLNHAGFKGLLFLCAGEVLHATGTLRMDLLGGLQKKIPQLGVIFAMGAASIACLPPFSGFASEFAICIALANGSQIPGVENQLGSLFALGIVALVSGLACALYVKAYGITFLGQPRSGFAENAHKPAQASLLPLLIPLAACIAGGLCAPVFFKLAANAALASAPVASPLLPACVKAQNTLVESYTKISLFSAAAIVLVGIIYAFRKILLQRRNPQIHSTWSCGYQAGTVRIQYTDASFSEPLARIFNPVMGIKINYKQSDSILPRKAHFSISAPDRVKNDFFAPLFALVEQFANACKIIQHGKIHIYILYIVATVVGVLLWGFWS